MSDLLTAALRYAELGYAVFPCQPGGKTPLTNQGFHDASTDASQITAWWGLHPTANIAIATTGLLVIDVDGAGNDWLADSPEKLLELAAAPISLTPNGGRHYVFRPPDGRTYRCHVGKLAPHVDVRADGGYIVVPPSILAGGGSYCWQKDAALDISREHLPQPPSWLAAELERVAASSPTLAQVAAGSAEANPIPSGQRNATLAALAGTMRRVGMSEVEIRAALLAANADRCVPPLSVSEVERIATSVARYQPDQVATALAEGHWRQMLSATGAGLSPVCLTDLVAQHPSLRPPVIHGLLRRGETMNIISASKIGKSWLSTDLALAVATGVQWLEMFVTESGPVLVIDNELHPETSAYRIPKVAAAKNTSLAEVGDRLFVQNLRGRLRDIFTMGPYFQSLEPGRFKLVILDAFYRFMPKDKDENDNGTMANIYNYVDSYADYLGCSFVLIHHSSKGNQSAKSLTDVGAGAGSQSRAVDTHLVLRPHEEDDVVVLEAAVRSWPPVPPRCLRWTFPVWTPDDNLDPKRLRSERPKRTPRTPETTRVAGQKEQAWDAASFAAAFVTRDPQSRDLILASAASAGLSDWKAERLLRRAEATGVIFRWGQGRNRPSSYATVSQPLDNDF